MDKELEARTESRRIPKSEVDDLDNITRSDNGREEVKGSIDMDAHILSNLLESLDASGGETGPVVNILKEMEGSG